jgi:hypothetical protein
MSRQLGGLRLGMSVAEFVVACRATGAKDIVSESEGTILCTVPPEPLSAQPLSVPLDGVVVGAFCGPNTTVCELAYVIYGKPGQRDDQIRGVVGALSRKYGPPTASQGHAADDPASECAAGKSAVHFERSWSFGPEQRPPHPLGRVRLVFDCDLRDGRQQVTMTLFSDDEHGLRSRTKEHGEQAP